MEIKNLNAEDLQGTLMMMTLRVLCESSASSALKPSPRAGEAALWHNAAQEDHP